MREYIKDILALANMIIIIGVLYLIGIGLGA
jgi:hypothetical protein